MTDPIAHHTLDAEGLYCPEPVMLLHVVVRKALVGEVIYVRATDPASERDIPKFCHFLGHELLSSRVVEQLYEYWICKK